MQISYPYIVWNNVPKFHENRASSFWAMRQSMCVIVVSPPTPGAGAHKLDRYPFRKTSYPRSEKWKNHKNSTNSKMNFYIIFITIFFLRFILKTFQGGEDPRYKHPSQHFPSSEGGPGPGLIYIFFTYCYIISSM